MVDASLWSPGASGVGPFSMLPGSVLPGVGGKPITGDGDLVTGEIVEWGAAAAPANWLLCDGTLYAQVARPALFAVIGVIFNQPGDPAGFFRVPDIRGRIVYGVGSAIALGANEGAAEAARNPISHGHAGNISYDAVPVDPFTLMPWGVDHIWNSDTGFTNFASQAAFGATQVAVGDVFINWHGHSLLGGTGMGWSGSHQTPQTNHAHADGGTLNDVANWPSHIGLNYIIYAG